MSFALPESLPNIHFLMHRHEHAFKQIFEQKIKNKFYSKAVICSLFQKVKKLNEVAVGYTGQKAILPFLVVYSTNLFSKYPCHMFK